MAHVRTPEAQQNEDRSFRLVFLVPDNIEGLEGSDAEQRRFLFANIGHLLEHTPQAALLHPRADFPDDDATSILHRGEQPANKQRIVIHYPKAFVDSVGAGIYKLDWFTLASSAESVRLVKADGTEVFLKDRWGWDE